MPPTGCAARERMLPVEAAKSLDIVVLQSAGALKAGCDATVHWKQGDKERCAIAFHVESGIRQPVATLRFRYVARSAKGAGTETPIGSRVSIATSSCHFGGSRLWFICPLSRNGKPCQRRCRKLYLPPGARYLGCRECHRLTYESRQRHREGFYELHVKPQRDQKRIMAAKPSRSKAVCERRLTRFMNAVGAEWATQRLLSGAYEFGAEGSAPADSELAETVGSLARKVRWRW